MKKQRQQQGINMIEPEIDRGRLETGSQLNTQLERQAFAVPLPARSLAVSLPIPVFAPVMMTVFPSNLSSDDQRLQQHTPLKIIKQKVKHEKTPHVA